MPFLIKTEQFSVETESDPEWMKDEFSPPTLCFNISVTDDRLALSVRGGYAGCRGAFGPMPDTATADLLARVRQAADEAGLEFETRLSGDPFYRDPSSLVVREALGVTGGMLPCTVGFGTDTSVLQGLVDAGVLGPGLIDQSVQGGRVYLPGARHRCVRALHAPLVRRAGFGMS